MVTHLATVSSDLHSHVESGFLLVPSLFHEEDFLSHYMSYSFVGKEHLTGWECLPSEKASYKISAAIFVSVPLYIMFLRPQLLLSGFRGTD